jgi:hypothetical protein
VAGFEKKLFAKVLARVKKDMRSPLRAADAGIYGQHKNGDIREQRSGKH